MEFQTLSKQTLVRKPFVKMQIEKVSLRTTETMGEYCQRLSSSVSQGQGDESCALQITGHGCQGVA